MRTQLLRTVGENLRTARTAAGMTQKDVGDAIGVRDRDVSRWENGRVEPGAMYRQLLADLLFKGSVAAIYEPTARAAA